MPYRKKYVNNRRPRPSKRGVRKFGRRAVRSSRLVNGKSPWTKAEQLIKSGASTASTVASLVRNVGTIMSMINTEKKFLDYSIEGATLPSLPTGFRLDPLTLMAMGDDDSQRNGNQVLASDLSLRVRFRLGATITHPQTIRMILLCDREFDGNMASGLYPNYANVTQSTASILSPINRDFSKRFVILKSAVYNVNPNTPEVEDKIYMKTPWHLFYDGSTGNIVDAKENQIFLLTVTDSLDDTNNPQISFYSRVNYYDN